MATRTELDLDAATQEESHLIANVPTASNPGEAPRFFPRDAEPQLFPFGTRLRAQRLFGAVGILLVLVASFLGHPDAEIAAGVFLFAIWLFLVAALEIQQVCADLRARHLFVNGRAIMATIVDTSRMMEDHRLVVISYSFGLQEFEYIVPHNFMPEARTGEVIWLLVDESNPSDPRRYAELFRQVAGGGRLEDCEAFSNIVL